MMCFPTVESLDAFDVVLSQREACTVGVDGVHQGASVCGVGHTEGVAQLMGRHYKQVVSCGENRCPVLIINIQFSDDYVEHLCATLT